MISTGTLPREELVVELMQDAHDRYVGVDDGEVADYIPALAQADPALFGLSIVSVTGASHSVGDARHEFSIQSVSKAFVFALVCDALGPEAVLEAVGVNNTGLPFNSVMALELNGGSPMNPLVNAGALTTTSLAPGRTGDEKWAFVQAGLSAFAGRPLVLDDEVYASEAAHNRRNQAIARLLESYGRITHDPLEVTDVYTRQCSLLVSAFDLAVMGATLADGGVNPVTGERVVDAVRVPLRARGPGDQRPVRALGRVAVQHRAARQERGVRRHRHRRAGQGVAGHVLAPPRRRGQQRPGPAGHPLPVGRPRAEPVRVPPGGRRRREEPS